MDADAHAHARSCALLGFAADLSDVARADARHRAAVEAAKRKTKPEDEGGAK